MNQIKIFCPTILVLDWCHNQNSYTAKYLKANAIVSHLILQNEEFLLSRTRWIRLSEPQKNVLEDARSMTLGDGPLVFIEGPFGSGKTILGIEVARI